MNAPAATPDDALDRIRRSSEARGFRFFLNPTADVLPSFLLGFQPDALAVGPQGGMVFELKRRGAPEPSGERAAELARRMSGQNGWAFRAIDLGPTPDRLAAIPIPTPDQIAAAISEAASLPEAGHPRVALLAAWAALEALARLAAANSGSTNPSALTPIQAVQTLAGLGYLEEPDAEYLRQLSRLCNAIAHGDLDAAPAPAALDRLFEQLHAIERDLRAGTPR